MSFSTKKSLLICTVSAAGDQAGFRRIIRSSAPGAPLFLRYPAVLIFRARLVSAELFKNMINLVKIDLVRFGRS